MQVVVKYFHINRFWSAFQSCGREQRGMNRDFFNCPDSKMQPTRWRLSPARRASDIPNSLQTVVPASPPNRSQEPPCKVPTIAARFDSVTICFGWLSPDIFCRWQLADSTVHRSRISRWSRTFRSRTTLTLRCASRHAPQLESTKALRFTLRGVYARAVPRTFWLQRK